MDSEKLISSESAPNHDEILMHQSLLFTDNLRELKNLRKQLYEAAEYFEVSYSREEHKEMVVNSLKDYAVKALINTVDHLGSIAYRVTNLFDEKTADIHGTDVRLQSIEQRMQTCQEYVGQRALSQQLFLIPTPRHHKIYILPETKQVSGLAQPKTNRNRLRVDDKLHQIGNGIQVHETALETPRLNVSRERHKSPSPRQFSRQGNFTFTKPSLIQKPEEPVTCTNSFLLMRTGSLLKRSTSPSNRQRNPFEPQTRRTVSLSAAAGRDRARDIEQYSSKGKGMFKTLLSMRKPKNDGAFHKFLDDY